MRRLILPLEPMAQQYLQSRGRFLTVPAAHGFQLLHPVADIHFLEAALFEQLRRLLRPGVDVVVVKLA